MHLRYRQKCRICGSDSLTKVIDLGSQYLQGSFVKPGIVEPPKRKIPMILVRCDPTRDQSACGLLQMAVSVPPQLLYSSYWYRSGTNQTMRDHLRTIAAEAAELSGKETAVVLDIGCNDGTLLSCFAETHTRIGVDPSSVAKGITGNFQIIHDFFPSTALNGALSGRRCDIVSSIAMFYDLEQPVEFVKALKNLLAPDGIWIFEMSYMPQMLAMNSYDTICHEHLEYYSFTVIERLLSFCEMKVVKVGFNDINGGSIRCHATHNSCSKYDKPSYQNTIAEIRHREFELELDTDEPYRQFQARIEDNRRELLGLLRGLRQQGKSVHIYGASTKGNTILQWCGIDSKMIDCAADRNPEKDGARTLGTDIPIVTEEKSRAKRPDYYLVLPWHFRDEFVRRERDMIMAGTKLIFPLPEMQVVGREELTALESLSAIV